MPRFFIICYLSVCFQGCACLPFIACVFRAISSHSTPGPVCHMFCRCFQSASLVWCLLGSCRPSSFILSHSRLGFACQYLACCIACITLCFQLFPVTHRVRPLLLSFCLFVFFVVYYLYLPQVWRKPVDVVASQESVACASNTTLTADSGMWCVMPVLYHSVLCIGVCDCAGELRVVLVCLICPLICIFVYVLAFLLPRHTFSLPFCDSRLFLRFCMVYRVCFIY